MASLRFPHLTASASLCLLAACTTAAHASEPWLTRSFDPFQLSQPFAYYDSRSPGETVLRSDGPTVVPGIVRTFQIAPVLGGTGFMSMGLVDEWIGGPPNQLFMAARQGQVLSATLSYGLDQPMNLDWQGVTSLVLMYGGASAHQLTVYARSDAPAPGDNPWGSALTLDIGETYETAIVLPLADFRPNGGPGVNWADLDSLDFAFSGFGEDYFYITGISTFAAAVPEPQAWALWTAGLCGLAGWLQRRRPRARA